MSQGTQLVAYEVDPARLDEFLDIKDRLIDEANSGTTRTVRRACGCSIPPGRPEQPGPCLDDVDGLELPGS